MGEGREGVVEGLRGRRFSVCVWWVWVRCAVKWICEMEIKKKNLAQSRLYAHGSAAKLVIRRLFYNTSRWCLWEAKLIRHMPMGVYQPALCSVCVAEAWCIMHEVYSFGKRTKCFDTDKFNSLVFQPNVDLSCLTQYLLSKKTQLLSGLHLIWRCNYTFVKGNSTKLITTKETRSVQSHEMWGKCNYVLLFLWWDTAYLRCFFGTLLGLINHLHSETCCFSDHSK